MPIRRFLSWHDILRSMSVTSGDKERRVCGIMQGSLMVSGTAWQPRMGTSNQVGLALLQPRHNLSYRAHSCPQGLCSWGVDVVNLHSSPILRQLSRHRLMNLWCQAFSGAAARLCDDIQTQCKFRRKPHPKKPAAAMTKAALSSDVPGGNAFPESLAKGF